MTEQQSTSPSKAVARVPVTLGVPIGDLDQAWRVSQALAVADLLPKPLKGKPSDVLAIILYGQDLGLSAMQAIQNIYVVKGKPQLSATTWLAKARQKGHKVWFPEMTDTKCTMVIQRADDPEHPHTETYTIQDAVQAKLVELRDGKPWARSDRGEALPWENHPRTMIRNRCISNGAKAACPEVAMGFGIEGDYDYVPDEPAEMAPPEHHGDVMANVPQDRVEQQIADMAGEYDFASQKDAEADDGIQDAEVVKDENDDAEPDATQEPFPEYKCSTCDSQDHFEDECPESTAAPR